MGWTEIIGLFMNIIRSFMVASVRRNILHHIRSVDDPKALVVVSHKARLWRRTIVYHGWESSCRRAEEFVDVSSRFFEVLYSKKLSPLFMPEWHPLSPLLTLTDSEGLLRLYIAAINSALLAFVRQDQCDVGRQLALIVGVLLSFLSFSSFFSLTFGATLQPVCS